MRGGLVPVPFGRDARVVIRHLGLVVRGGIRGGGGGGGRGRGRVVPDPAKDDSGDNLVAEFGDQDDSLRFCVRVHEGGRLVGARGSKPLPGAGFLRQDEVGGDEVADGEEAGHHEAGGGEEGDGWVEALEGEEVVGGCEEEEVGGEVDGVGD